MRELNRMAVLAVGCLVATAGAMAQTTPPTKKPTVVVQPRAAVGARPVTNRTATDRLAVVEKRAATFAGLSKSAPRSFVRRDPVQVRAMLQKHFPVTLNASQIKRFKELTFQNRRPMGMAETLKVSPLKPFKPVAVIARPDLRNFPPVYTPQAYPLGKVAIIVEQSLVAPCQPALNRYVEDIASVGYFGMLVTHSGGNVVQLKSYLKSVSDLAGAILVGNIPVSWYHNAKDFHDYPSSFPCDLFLMDLDGSWTDADGDGQFDGHSGNVAPEIFVARWPVHRITGTAATILNTWLGKNHEIRLGKKGSGTGACAFNDDDWSGFTTAGLELMLNPARITVVNANNQTTAAGYKTHLARDYNWLHFMCHSSPWNHVTHTDGGSVSWQDLKTQNPPHAFFQQMFNCSSARFTEQDFLGGHYVFGPATPHMLAAVGSTKPGSMLAFEQFYGPMGAGRMLGDAFAEWFCGRAPFDDEERCWFYGMTILGDPCANWSTPLVPVQQGPAEGTVFNTYPRLTTLTWNRIPGAGPNEYSYEVQVDYSSEGTWALDTGACYVRTNVGDAPAYTFTFVGAQPGRWRVRAIRADGAKPCAWSPWRTFTYLR